MRSTLTTQPESTPMLPGLRLQRDTQASDVIPASPAPTPDVEKPMSLIHALQRRKQTSHLDFSDDDGATQGLGTPRTSTFEPFEDNISPACTKADGEQNCPIHFPVNGGGLFTAKEYLQVKADELRNDMQYDFRKHDRERAKYESKYQSFCRTHGKADTDAKYSHHKTMVKAIGKPLRALAKSRMDIAIQEGDEDYDDL